MTTDDDLRADHERARVERTKIVVAMVTVSIPDFHQTRIEAEDGHQYAVVRRTAGIPWDQLQEGQRVRCLVTTDSFPRCVEVLEVL
jgi:hypothetical protein